MSVQHNPSRVKPTIWVGPVTFGPATNAWDEDTDPATTFAQVNASDGESLIDTLTNPTGGNLTVVGVEVDWSASASPSAPGSATFKINGVTLVSASATHTQQTDTAYLPSDKYQPLSAASIVVTTTANFGKGFNTRIYEIRFLVRQLRLISVEG